MSGSLFLGVRIVSTAIDALVAVAVLIPLSRRWALGPSLAVAVGAAGTAFLVKLVPWAVLGLGFFGLVHLAYLDLIVVPSVLVVVGFVLQRRRGTAWWRRPAAAFAAGLAACAAPLVGAYASFVEPYDLRLETTHIPVRSADLFHGAADTFDGQLPGLRGLMARLRAPGGVYFALGDADTREELAAICAGTDVRLLVNEAHRIVIKGRAVTIAGVELDSRRPAAAAFLRALEQAPGDDLRLLVSHRPDAVLRLARHTRVDLVIAGHTHGGQVQLPLFGPPVILSQVPRSVGAGGYHIVDDRAVYVSRGVGHEGGQAPRIRFLCPPEVSLLLLGLPGFVAR
jgi:predicted MPP superfamily phosphohydrolase